MQPKAEEVADIHWGDTENVGFGPEHPILRGGTIIELKLAKNNPEILRRHNFKLVSDGKRHVRG